MHTLFNPVNVLIGEDSLSKFPSIIENRKYTVITNRGFKERGWDQYFKHAECIIDTVSPNPTIDDLISNVEVLKNIDCDVLVAIGGGSVLDSAKALSVISEASEKNIVDLLQGNRDSISQLYEVIAIPTTAGTGAEVTPFATVWDSKNKKKLSLFSTCIYPTTAIIDPSLTLSLSAEMTAISGLDALSHCLESLWNKNANRYSRLLAFDTIEAVFETLPILLDNLSNLEMRLKMSWAALYGGLCINLTKTALAHSMSYPLTSHLQIPHGLAAGAFLREIMDFNRKNDKSGLVESIHQRLSISELLDTRFNRLFKCIERLNLLQIFKGNQSKIMDLLPEMINPARSKNNILDVSLDDVKTILDKFYSR